jgi:hypothetical protein
MKVILLVTLLVSLTIQDTVLLSSCPDNTLVINPPKTHTALETYHSINNPNYIGYNAQWIYKKGCDSWVTGDRATFFTEFYADCTKTATLIITADDSFTARLNKGAAWTGISWRQIYRFTINNLRCGVNVL